MKLFLLKISEAKDIKISVLYGLPVEKFEKKKKMKLLSIMTV